MSHKPEGHHPGWSVPPADPSNTSGQDTAPAQKYFLLYHHVPWWKDPTTSGRSWNVGVEATSEGRLCSKLPTAYLFSLQGFDRSQRCHSPGTLSSFSWSDKSKCNSTSNNHRLPHQNLLIASLENWCQEGHCDRNTQGLCERVIYMFHAVAIEGPCSQVEQHLTWNKGHKNLWVFVCVYVCVRGGGLGMLGK